MMPASADREQQAQGASAPPARNDRSPPSVPSVEYRGYSARWRPHSVHPLRAVAGRAYRFLRNTVLFDTLLYPYGLWCHARLRRASKRSQAHTFTCFHRSPLQTEALLGASIEFLSDRGTAGRKLEILVFACSNGAEVYTLASMLLHARPDLDFHVCGSDLHEEMVGRAVTARYSHDEVWHSESVSEAFVERTFERVGDEYHVRPLIQSRTSFTTANLLDPTLESQYRPADIVFAQSVLSHLTPEQATVAFDGLVRCMKPRSALFIRGMDLDEKIRLTREHELAPLDYQCRAIHEEGRRHVGHHWWRLYYGAEPYSLLRPDRIRRFGTIFLRGAGPTAGHRAHL